jgi:hypothetical protein
MTKKNQPRQKKPRVKKRRKKSGPSSEHYSTEPSASYSNINFRRIGLTNVAPGRHAIGPDGFLLRTPAPLRLEYVEADDVHGVNMPVLSAESVGSIDAQDSSHRDDPSVSGSARIGHLGINPENRRKPSGQLWRGSADRKEE